MELQTTIETIEAHSNNLKLKNLTEKKAIIKEETDIVENSETIVICWVFEVKIWAKNWLK